ncbi:MAG: hypothetical protein D6753_14830 [Planctomycetota bacterium]|nr:MAG: hypothetical protein D6753_14830 [Planctomycetota bacterium]
MAWAVEVVDSSPPPHPGSIVTITNNTAAAPVNTQNGLVFRFVIRFVDGMEHLELVLACRRESNR